RQLFQTTTLAITWAITRVTTSSVRLYPKSAETMKQNPSAAGITKVGRGQSFPLAREIKELLSRNITGSKECLIRIELSGYWESPLVGCQSVRAIRHPTVSQWCASVYLLINGAKAVGQLSQTNRWSRHSDENSIILNSRKKAQKFY